MAISDQFSMTFSPQAILGGLTSGSQPPLLDGGTWYQAEAIGDGLGFTFPAGTLAQARFLQADFLLDGIHLAVFVLSLREGEDGPEFGYSFGLLNQCSARMRMPLEAVNMNRWRYPREGAFLKPRCGGQRVDLSKVDRMTIRVEHKGPRPVRWCMTPITASMEKPPRLKELTLPKGKLLDELGQSNLHSWKGRSNDTREVSERLHSQAYNAAHQRWPEHFSRWGGWKERQFEGTGYFRTQHDGQRWWLVDPEGYAYWSAGQDCVHVDIDSAYTGLEPALTWLPDPNGEYAQAYEKGGEVPLFSYLAANFIRAFGVQDWRQKWEAITMAELRRTGFNTVANWSDWQAASRAGMPYVRPMPRTYEELPCVYRDFPDVFHPDFEATVQAYAEALKESKDDPAFIGYFLMNEPTWGFAQETPAAGMLFNTPECHTRNALGEFLRQRYGADEALANAWGTACTLDEVRAGEWKKPLNATAQADLADFSAVMVEKFFGGLSKACKAVDPNHLNLGIRYYTTPPAWALAGMKYFDVFSMNCYKPRVPAEEMAKISAMLNQPVIIGEWHFGALDVGLPATGIGHVPDQKQRGTAYRFYLEDAAAKPWCVGVHHFILYDQSAIGRFDGENYNIGFLDVCNRPYEELCAAARLSHERMYAVAAGQVEPYGEQPEYLPLLFM